MVNVYKEGDLYLWVPVAKETVKYPARSFLPFKGLNDTYRHGYKAQISESSYLDALSDIQSAYLNNESKIFRVKNDTEDERQYKAKWRHGIEKNAPLLGHTKGWVKVELAAINDVCDNDLANALEKSGNKHCELEEYFISSKEKELERKVSLKPNYKDLTSRDAVIKAIDEFDELGRKEFLSKYGFGKSRQFFLVYEGKQYDSKAIFGAAFGYQFSRSLQSDEFSGGNETVRPILEKLKFTVIANSVDDTISLAEETTDKMWEGAKRTITVNLYERSNKARLACIEHHGSRCKVCSIDFGEVYGHEFHGFIHVHHLTAVSEVNSRYEVDPKNDLIPLCPNCHAVIHYGGKTRTLEEIKHNGLRKMLSE